MDNPFYPRPILILRYEYPRRHWEPNRVWRPIHEIRDSHLPAQFVTRVIKPKKRKSRQGIQQRQLTTPPLSCTFVFASGTPSCIASQPLSSRRFVLMGIICSLASEIHAHAQ
jgi:hypothetical protein